MFAAADIAVVPSRREGQGIAALEAMASGVAVIASDVGGLPEMIAHDTTGILTPPDDARSLADSIGRLVADAALRASIADAGKNWTLANADVRLRIKQIEDVYDSVPMARGSD
jgi:glycosyltransferase involved in cell wall biosynthesis